MISAFAIVVGGCASPPFGRGAICRRRSAARFAVAVRQRRARCIVAVILPQFREARGRPIGSPSGYMPNVVRPSKWVTRTVGITALRSCNGGEGRGRGSERGVDRESGGERGRRNESESEGGEGEGETNGGRESLSKIGRRIDRGRSRAGLGRGQGRGRGRGCFRFVRVFKGPDSRKVTKCIVGDRASVCSGRDRVKAGFPSSHNPSSERWGSTGCVSRGRYAYTLRAFLGRRVPDFAHIASLYAVCSICYSTHITK